MSTAGRDAIQIDGLNVYYLEFLIIQCDSLFTRHVYNLGVSSHLQITERLYIDFKIPVLRIK